VSRRLRAFVDPLLLVSRLELEVERLTRTAHPDWLGRPRFLVHYDTVTVRRGGAARSFHQLCGHALRGDRTALEQVARALQSEHDLRPLDDLRERAEMLQKWMRPESLDRSRVRDADRVDSAEPVQDSGGVPEFINPELSLLAFQLRVLALAESPSTPLGERIRFLGIVSANMDEFFMVRMAGLRGAAREQFEEQGDDGLTRGEQLHRILEWVAQITSRQANCYTICVRELAAIGVRILRWSELNPREQKELRARCRDEIQPALTPLAMTLSPGHPLPHLPHLALSLAVVFRREEDGRPHLAQLELPSDTPRFLVVPGRSGDVVTIEEVTRANLDLLYPNAHAGNAYLFRVTRGGDLGLDEDSNADLLDAVERATVRRSLNPAIRVEVEREMPSFVRELVLESLRREDGTDDTQVQSGDLQESEALLDLRCLSTLELPRLPGLRYERLDARKPVPADESFFAAMQKRDLLFHHPFDEFDATVVRFLREASVDPAVTTMEITLYRVGDTSPVVDALVAAAGAGKRVVAFVELKARFDEEYNVAWARALEKAEGHVVYGLTGLKNHAKVALVVRREGGKLRRYVHVGTGNYNARSGVQYTDLSLFSARDELTADIADLFNELTGSSRPPEGLSRGALVAPHQLLPAILGKIERETQHALAGRKARISAKMNGLSDPEVVRALYRASTGGVEIDLVVRGICTLRPGVPGRSDRIRVVSVAGRLLEHSRVYRFDNDGDPEYYIGSSDLRPRNLRRRVELLVPIIDSDNRELLDRVLDLYQQDPSAYELRPDGSYRQRSGGERRGAQDWFTKFIGR